MLDKIIRLSCAFNDTGFMIFSIMLTLFVGTCVPEFLSLLWFEVPIASTLFFIEFKKYKMLA